MNRLSRRRRFATALLLLIGTSWAAASQSAAAHQKVLTPEQKTYQAQMAAYLTQHESLRTKAQSAFDAEMNREKTGDCRSAVSTREMEECLSAEIAKTQANYSAFAGAIRSMLALEVPTLPSAPSYSGPTGTAPTAAQNVAEFDQLEAESKHYREDAAKAAYNRYKSGTFSPVFGAQAEQRLLRLHFQELAFVYESLLLNR
jgi:hypothetical protein